MRNIFKLNWVIALLLIATAPSFAVQEGQIAPPPVELVDRFGVNLATGQVVQKLNTVAIGGDLGLSHHIQVNANHFVKTGGHGYMDAFAGGAKYVNVINTDGVFSSDAYGNVQLKTTGASMGTWVYLMRVFGPAGGYDFVVYKNGYIPNASSNPITSGYTYRPLGDSRHSLIQKTEGGKNYLVWTTPDGIKTRYDRGSSVVAHNGGRLVDVTYPNGFKVSVDFGGVVTNTGFMLKYQFVGSWPGALTWGANPFAISGINLADTYCPLSSTQSCDGTGWPTAKFGWPVGSPDVFYIPHSPQNRILKVNDQYGGITEYHYQTQNICMYSSLVGAPEAEDPVCAAKYLNGSDKWSPRLIGIKTANSSVLDFTYEYKNDGSIDSASPPTGTPGLHSFQWYWTLNTKEGRLSKAIKQDLSALYGKPSAVDSYGSAFYREVFGNRVEFPSDMPGKLLRVNWKTGGEFKFEQNSRNFLISHRPVSGALSGFLYDSRGNLEEIKTNGLAMQKAFYPTACSDTDFRFCNKPIWITDAKGNQTDYTYHAESGQVKTVTRPAVTINSVSVRPKTTYEYSSLYAYYKKNSNTVERADDPIWMLTREFLCRTSNATESGCSAGDLDKVETNYYYGPQDGTPNNLFLRGTSVTGEGSLGVLETRVTCYEYDKYGRKIAETRPKGTSSLTSCP